MLPKIVITSMDGKLEATIQRPALEVVSQELSPPHKIHTVIRTADPVTVQANFLQLPLAPFGQSYLQVLLTNIKRRAINMKKPNVMICIMNPTRKIS